MYESIDFIITSTYTHLKHITKPKKDMGKRVELIGLFGRVGRVGLIGLIGFGPTRPIRPNSPTRPCPI